MTDIILNLTVPTIAVHWSHETLLSMQTSGTSYVAEQNMHPQPLAHVPNMGLCVERLMINHQSYGQAVNNSAMIHMYLWCNRHGYWCSPAFSSVVPVIFRLKLHYFIYYWRDNGSSCDSVNMTFWDLRIWQPNSK